MARVNVEIVKRSDHAKGFVVLPKRWVVERTFASAMTAISPSQFIEERRRCKIRSPGKSGKYQRST